MSDKPNARELAIESIWQQLLNHFANNNWHLNEDMVKNIIRKGIDTYLSAPDKDTMEMVRKIREFNRVPRSMPEGAN